MKSFLIPVNFSPKNEEHVQILQQALIALNYATESSFSSKSYDSAIQAEIQSFRVDNALPTTNNMNAQTIQMLNAQLEELYRVYGELKDDYGMPIEGSEIIVYESTYDNNTTERGRGKSLSDGSYRVYLTIPNTTFGKNGLLKNKMCISVEIKQNNSTKLVEGNLFIQEKENIYNFSSATFEYKGKSVYQSLIEQLLPHNLATAVGDDDGAGVGISSSGGDNGVSGDAGAGDASDGIDETPVIVTNLSSKTIQELVNISAATGIEMEALMKLFFAEVLEAKATQSFNGRDRIFSNIDAETFFAFIFQNIPGNMPSSLFSEELLQAEQTGWIAYKDKISEQVNIGLALMSQETLHDALLSACKTYVINIHDDTWINDNVNHIISKKDAVAANSPLLEGDIKISDVITAVVLTFNPTQITNICNLFIANIDDINKFIDTLNEAGNRTLYGSTNIDKLILAFQLSQVTRNHTPLIKSVITAHQSSFNSYGIRFIATVSLSGWVTLINGNYPFAFTNAGEYAQFVYDNAQKLYPEIATIAKIANMQSQGSGKFQYTQDIKNVLLSNKQRDILVDKIDDFTINANLKNDPAFMEEIKTMQRVHRISPSAEATATLLDNGITSAAQVYFMGKEHFAATFQDTLSQSEINNAYAMASARYANALIAFTNLNSAFYGNNPYALPQYDIQSYISNLENEISNIEQLFGSQDHCECDTDSSVYSPAAYLADLLLFLDEQKEGNNTLLKCLQARRADISKIKLTKQNTKTMLPYIDLVNEVLEEAVIKSVEPSFKRADSTCQSNLTTEELCAAPEHILKSSTKGTAYDVIKRSMYPMYAPIHLEQMESRAYLAKMGIARHDLMTAFGKDAENLTNHSIAAEYFGLTNLEQIVITAQTTNGYTLAQRNEAWKQPLGTGTSAIAMDVNDFMHDTWLSAYEVLDVLAATWTKLSGANITEDCSIKDKKVTNTPAGFDRTHRFIRLWRKSGWKMWELNLLLCTNMVTNYTNENTDNLNAVALQNLHLFSKLQKTLGLPCDSLAAFFGNINTVERYENGKQKPSLYEKIFLNTAIENPVNKNLEDIKDIIKNPSKTIAANGDDDELIAACLSISKKDYELLKSKYTAAKDLKYLSYLYRSATFAKKLKISIPEFITIFKMMGEVIASPYSIGSVNDIIAIVQSIKESKISVWEYEYLTRYGYNVADVSDEAKALALTDEQLKEYVEKLYNEIYQEKNDEEVEENPVDIAVINQIAKLFDLSTTIVETYLNNPINSEECLLDYIFDFYEEYKTHVQQNPQTASALKIYKVLILLHKASFLIKKNNITPEQFDLLLAMQDKIKLNWFAFKTDGTAISLSIPTVSSLPLLTLQEFLSLSNMLFLNKLYGVIAEDSNVSISKATSSAIQNTTVEKTLLNLLDSVTAPVIENSPSASFISNLCKLTGWSISDCTTLIGNNGFAFKYKDFYKRSSYTKIQNCMEMLDSMNVSAAIILNGTAAYSGWKVRETNEAKEVKQNAAIKGVLKARYDVTTWLKELATIQKPIREAKADALSSYLIAVSIRNTAPNAKPILDKNDLYNIFLLDPQMSADMKTSRIVQATCAVQIFMQRIFLNLEVIGDISIKENKWKQWEWMKRYRLWEANFKVFLYPENFIEPELRDDKSPFFKEMEDELNQSDITEDHVENVFTNYLQKLHDVSNLTVVGLYKESITDDKNSILHVVGRSRSTPYQYYYRNFNQASKAWSHWEKIELDIKGEVVVPVVHKRKLHLFWLHILEKTYNATTKEDAENEIVKDSVNFTEIQLEWSVLKNKKWAPVKVSKKKLVQSEHAPVFDYSLVAKNENNEIALCVYRYDLNGNDDRCILSGYFNFHGDVYRSTSNIYYYTGTDTEKDKAFNGITSKMSYDEKPESELKYKDNITSFETTVYPTFRSSRLCQTYNNNGNKKNIFVANHHYSKVYGHWNVKLLGTANPYPTLIPDVHNQETMWWSICRAHATSPSFYQDAKRSFFIRPQLLDTWNIKYDFYPFYHPYTDLFIEELNRKGIDGFLNRDLQLLKAPYVPSKFTDEYTPGHAEGYLETVFQGGTTDVIDFHPSGAYSPYNWELFFHAPLYIACKLSQNQKYEEAMKWFHYIFNPTDKSANEIPKKFWVTKPFFDLAAPESWQEQMKSFLEKTEEQITVIQQWIDNPFNPHLVARTRNTAYQKTVVMKYIDNIIAWADNLFRQDTMEANNEATLLYILAYAILGKRPITIPEKGLDPAILKSYEQVAAAGDIYAFLDDFDIQIPYNYNNNTNARSTSNKKLTTSSKERQNSNYEMSSQSSSPLVSDGDEGMSMAYPDTMIMVQEKLVSAPHITNPKAMLAPHINPKSFCVPFNEKLLHYWDTVEDRLFKLRHCMNIDGLVRELPLFAPPIDPMMLVKAAAAGLPIADALNEINAKQPYYRFRVILQKAIEFTGEVKQLGEKLLAALEKKDAEVLSLLRSSQEINMQQAMKQVRNLQIEEAKQNIVALEQSIKNTEARKEYYGNKELMNSLETDAYRLNTSAAIMNDIVVSGYATAAILSLIPSFQVGGAGVAATPFAVVKFGGEELGASLSATMAALTQISQSLDKHASLLLTKSSYQRRKEDWDFQAQTADLEITQLDKQKLAAEIRLMVAEKELQNMELQIEQSQSVNEYYKDKFTNEHLYNWMITEISKVYLSAYKLAYDMAKKAELCYRKELGIYESTTTYIQFGYWDSLKKGLLAGDRMMHDLHRLDAAYINENKRTLELTKHISMAQMFPKELIALITEKNTTLKLKEYLFDMDYPGHYMRRIKSVSVTIPNVAGPNTTVSFMLQLNRAKVRLNNLCGDPNIINTGYVEEPFDEDSRFNYQTGGDMICTSSAQNDSGLFELNFGDDRYLPFENAGAISEWNLSFPAGCNQFDLSTVSDVILHINYTAEYSGTLALKARAALETELPNAGRIFFSLKHGFSAEWGQLNQSNNEMKFNIKMEHLPFFLRGKADEMNVSDVALVLVSKNTNPNNKALTLTNEEALNVGLILNTPPLPCGDLHLYNANASPSPAISVIGEWTASLGTIDVDDVEDIIIGFNLTEE